MLECLIYLPRVEFQRTKNLPFWLIRINGNYAIVATSHTRENKTFSELKFQENLAKKNARTKCGLHVINLKTGDVEHSLTIEGVIQELYDVISLPNVIRPQAIGTRNNQIKHTISIKE